MTKTNAMRLLDQAKVPYELQTYPFDEADLSGLHAAEALGMSPAQIFKTLVTRGERQGIQVFCIPVDANLDLKKAARVSGDKKIAMLPLKELLGVTGYVRGGCSPIGMKNTTPPFSMPLPWPLTGSVSPPASAAPSCCWTPRRCSPPLR